jgi:hypothetical protein
MCYLRQAKIYWTLETALMIAPSRASTSPLHAPWIERRTTVVLAPARTITRVRFARGEAAATADVNANLSVGQASTPGYLNRLLATPGGRGPRRAVPTGGHPV